MLINTEVIHVDIPNKEKLYQSYMPFVQGGGLFISSQLSIAMGADISLSIHLPEQSQPILLNAKVIWLTQKQNGLKPQGFAVQLIGEMGLYCHTEVEKLLKDFKAYTQTSYTM
ncbi:MULTISPECIES: PilZ domain-containing protein [unclassified Acinetobacter]|uniref:PilZ domain-containing protein n=1 Tax=unclassified Acinetobacter TaxID=196816 RepID=UPI002934D1A3|nr:MULTISPECIES: PilZ domain-containing protein [unclassified Acinetobacter]WOE32060.1 PilZ domain-containing protein [Acinetobacter sp. SAAs470]WOE37529.1 PilZ domain-containing protein [Acinetobacter sp. SAAs474]